MRAMELTISTVIIIIVLLVTMVSILIFFRGGFEVTGAAMADIVNESSSAATSGEGVLPNMIDDCPNVYFGFWDCDSSATNPDCKICAGTCIGHNCE